MSLTRTIRYSPLNRETTRPSIRRLGLIVNCSCVRWYANIVGRLRMRGMMLFWLILLISSQGEASQHQGVYKKRFYLPSTLNYQSRYQQLINWSATKPYQLRVSKDLVTIVGTRVVLSIEVLNTFLQSSIPIRLVGLRYIDEFNILVY